MAAPTERDIQIFAILASGPRSFKDIQVGLQKHCGRDVSKTEDKREGWNYNMTDTALKTRLSRLRKDGFIKSARYRDEIKDGIPSYYVLGEKAKDLLVSSYGYKPTYIRNTLPDKKLLSHELLVVEAVKTVKAESAKLAYEMDMEDENYLKARARGAKKYHAYPDVHFVLMFETPAGTVIKDIALEIDNGTMDPALIVEKTRKLFDKSFKAKCTTHILSRTRERVEQLIGAFSRYAQMKETFANTADDRKIIEIFKKRVAFATVGDFCVKGFVNTNWLTMERLAGFVDPNKRPKK